jgi:hypothetical protein
MTSKGRIVYTPDGAVFPTFVEDEAAAYVAGSLFRIYNGDEPFGDPAIYAKASEIARAIADKKGAVVSPRDADVLKVLVRYDEV